jgi:hypothetical protein
MRDNAATQELNSYAWVDKGKGSRASRSIVQWNLRFTIWRQKSRRRQIN